MTSTPSAAPTRPPFWPWALAILALAWIGLVRTPLILNAEIHLDSDLAVDGLTVAEVVQGHWRWHFPGTPHIGIASVLFAGPQMLVWGANPISLSSGGVVAYAVLVLAVFVLAWTAFGRRVAAWSLVTLAFASTGMVWLSGRLNSGHLLAAAWHAGALALFYECLARGGWRRAAVLGLWCGLGLWHDLMFLITVAALVLVGPLAWFVAGRSHGGYVCAIVFVAGTFAGDLPREIGRRVDSYDAYPEQFAPLLESDVLVKHTEMLALECVPRLIVGHLLPGLESVPPPAALGVHRAERRGAMAYDPLAWATTLVGLGLLAAALVSLARDLYALQDIPRAAVCWAIWVSSAGIVAGFIMDRNIFDSDNYRYIIYLIVPWALGFGLVMERLALRGWQGLVAASGLSALLAVLITLDTARWYERFGWIDASGWPERRKLNDPALAWLQEHPEVTHIYGAYWDVYRLSFLTGARVRGVPFPFYPNRFPQWSSDLPGVRPEVVLVRPTPEGEVIRRDASREGARPLLESPNLAIYLWPARR